VSEINATFLFENNLGQSHGLLRQYLYWKNSRGNLITEIHQNLAAKESIGPQGKSQVHLPSLVQKGQMFN